MRNKSRAVLTAGLVAGLSVFAIPAGASSHVTYAHPKIHKWYVKQGGKQALSHLSSDMGAISQDATNDDETSLGTDCQNLRDDAQVAQAIKPIPSTAIERLWVAGLRDYEQGGEICVQGVNDTSASEIEQATSDLGAGNAVFKQLGRSL